METRIPFQLTLFWKVFRGNEVPMKAIAYILRKLKPICSHLVHIHLRALHSGYTVFPFCLIVLLFPSFEQFPEWTVTDQDLLIGLWPLWTFRARWGFFVWGFSTLTNTNISKGSTSNTVEKKNNFTKPCWLCRVENILDFWSPINQKLLCQSRLVFLVNCSSSDTLLPD